MKNPSTIVILTVAALCGTSPLSARSQAVSHFEDASSDPTVTTSAPSDLNYLRPTHKAMVENYVFDAYGPYPIGGAALAAGTNQFTNSPPEWDQGLKGYGRRFGSNLGIAVVSTTARYGLSQAFRQDSMYYRCECTEVLPRLGHSMISALTARRGEDGHRVFSLPALVGPYVGATTAVYGWYPSRFGAEDALRLGTYNLLIYMGGNIPLEFLYSGPHSLLSRMHVSNKHGAPDPGPNH